MKTKSTLRALITPAASTWLAAPLSRAATRTWDPADTTHGAAIDPGDGTWNTNE